MPIAFRAVIEIRGINPFVRVDSTKAEALKPGWRRPLPVLVRINGKPAVPWRVNMMPTGDGDFYLYLHDSVRKESGTVLGDWVRVEIDFDVSYRNGPQHDMPQWFEEALNGNPRAGRSWAALTPSRKKEILRYFSQLVSAEARARNLAKAIFVLSGEEGRFMARDWRNGS
jgi:hypothetical protein